jgi:hypothetical protein
MTAHGRERELRYFLLLEHDKQIEAIRRLAASGMATHTIAAATGLAVAQITRILGERPGQCADCGE